MQRNHNLIHLNYNDSISVDFKNEWINATKIAKQFGKIPSDWSVLDSTKRHEMLIIEEHPGIRPIIIKKGSPENGGGTWIHRLIAPCFARWLNKDFSYFCDSLIVNAEEIIKALNDFDVPEDLSNDYYIYGIQNVSTGNIKIGISKNPYQRLKQLQIGCDGKLRIVYLSDKNKSYKDEAKLHALNSHKNIHGEWFDGLLQ